MFFGWFKKRRRRKLLVQQFPEEWLAYLNRNVRFYDRLAEHEQAKLRDDLRILVAEKYWEGCKGFVVTDEVKVTIAAQAALLTIGMEEEYFDNVKSILVYPTAYIAEENMVSPGGVVREGGSAREGEAWFRGPVILSWDDVIKGGRDVDDGRNLVLHEFAHKLDMQTGGDVNGTPPLKSRAEYVQWQAILNEEYNRLRHACRQGRFTLLDCYGATDVAEFFAVATECFFEQAEEMNQEYPALYQMLSNYYHQNPALRKI